MRTNRHRCKDCDKFEYRADEIIRAALGTAKTTGLATRYYPCPTQKDIYHVSRVKGKSR